MKVVFPKGARASHVCCTGFQPILSPAHRFEAQRTRRNWRTWSAGRERRWRRRIFSRQPTSRSRGIPPSKPAIWWEKTRFHHSTQKGEGKTGDFGCDVGPCLGNSCYFMLGHVLESGPFGVWVGDEPEVSLTRKDTKLPPGGDTAPQGRGNNAAAWRRRSAVFCCLPPCK